MAVDPTQDANVPPVEAAEVDSTRRRLLGDLAKAGYALPVLVTLLAADEAHAVISLDPSCALDPNGCPQ